MGIFVMAAQVTSTDGQCRSRRRMVNAGPPVLLFTGRWVRTDKQEVGASHDVMPSPIPLGARYQRLESVDYSDWGHSW
ncbi:hypothetical protein R1flu_026803 [Riccia fluitans]|uniref:Uncharacterized protein n=1 Tax=Riccia fluitans TaxID=41844 RepID=A0ABD1XHH9_9MARC